MGKMKLNTGFVADANAAPKRGANMSTGIEVSDMLKETRSIVIAIIDESYPAGEIIKEYGDMKMPEIKPFLHALCVTNVALDKWNKPLPLTIPDGRLAERTLMLKNSFAENCYTGPNPPKSHVLKIGKHKYQIHISALDVNVESLNLTQDSDYPALKKAIEGKVIDVAYYFFYFGGD